MAIRRVAPQASVAEVLDRVLDRGIVIDAWLRVSVAGLTLLDVDARVVVASIDTYVRHSDAVARTASASRPPAPAARALTRASPAAPPAALPPPARLGRRPRRRLRCLFGCTFVRAAKRCPTTVRCPSDRTRACPVTVIPRAA